jgi:hypothetical protein
MALPDPVGGHLMLNAKTCFVLQSHYRDVPGKENQILLEEGIHI